jgi:hypothetical protein
MLQALAVTPVAESEISRLAKPGAVTTLFPEQFVNVGFYSIRGLRADF